RRSRRAAAPATIRREPVRGAPRREQGRAMDITPEQVLRDYAPRIYSVAYRLLNNEADAEDVTQDVLLQVVRKLDTFRGESSFPPWLYRVTVNAALAFRRKRALREGHRSGEDPDRLEGGATTAGPARRWALSPDQQAVDRETRELIERAVARLPEAYRDVYVL